jgi:hypothetical protein
VRLLVPRAISFYIGEAIGICELSVLALDPGERGAEASEERLSGEIQRFEFPIGGSRGRSGA